MIIKLVDEMKKQIDKKMCFDDYVFVDIGNKKVISLLKNVTNIYKIKIKDTIIFHIEIDDLKENDIDFIAMMLTRRYETYLEEIATNEMFNKPIISKKIVELDEIKDFLDIIKL